MAVTYQSTRGDSPALGFADTLLTGLAPDGGLYVPDHFPSLDDALRGLPEQPSYSQVASAVMWPFVDGSIARPRFDAIVEEAYSSFEDPAVCPLRQLDDGVHVLDLSGGPTFAFKDLALQLVGRLFDHELSRRGSRATVLVATSGDTGSAAMAACLGRSTLNCVVLFPHQRVSDVQRRQMTTLGAPNCHAVAVDGSFDDCQNLVKEAFADRRFRDEVSLSAMNSINWGRVMAQVVYYVTAARAVNGAPVFSVPSGNFGNVLAGWVAQQMGLDVTGFVVASNRNDFLVRWMESGQLVADEVVPTITPSMDIQISSNLERLLFELLGRDGQATCDLLGEFRSTGYANAPRPDSGWWGARLNEDEILDTIASVYRKHEILLDPHSAVGVGALQKVDLPDAPVVCLATAHPAKFPDAVERATGVVPPLPAGLSDLFDRDETATRCNADLSQVQAIVRSVLG